MFSLLKLLSPSLAADVDLSDIESLSRVLFLLCFVCCKYSELEGKKHHPPHDRRRMSDVAAKIIKCRRNREGKSVSEGSNSNSLLGKRAAGTERERAGLSTWRVTSV